MDGRLDFPTKSNLQDAEIRLKKQINNEKNSFVRACVCKLLCMCMCCVCVCVCVFVFVCERVEILLFIYLFGF